MPALLLRRHARSTDAALRLAHAQVRCVLAAAQGVRGRRRLLRARAGRAGWMPHQALLPIQRAAPSAASPPDGSPSVCSFFLPPGIQFLQHITCPSPPGPLPAKPACAAAPNAQPNLRRAASGGLPVECGAHSGRKWCRCCGCRRHADGGCVGSSCCRLPGGRGEYVVPAYVGGGGCSTPAPLAAGWRVMLAGTSFGWWRGRAEWPSSSSSPVRLGGGKMRRETSHAEHRRLTTWRTSAKPAP